MLTERIETVIVGGGQAGLANSAESTSFANANASRKCPVLADFVAEIGDQNSEAAGAVFEAHVAVCSIGSRL